MTLRKRHRNRHLERGDGEKAPLDIKASRQIIESARDAVEHTPGLTLVKLVEDALHEKLEHMEHRMGRQFPERDNAHLKTGPERGRQRWTATTAILTTAQG